MPETCASCAGEGLFACSAADCGMRLCYLHVLSQRLDQKTPSRLGLITRCYAHIDVDLAVPPLDHRPHPPGYCNPTEDISHV